MSTSKKTNEVKASNYKIIVLDSNKALKEDCNTLGYALKVLTITQGINKAIVDFCKKAKKDKAIYTEMVNNVRKTKKGYFRPFYVMQYIYKVTK